MRSAIAIAKKELVIYFTTPIAYVFFAVVALFAALFFNGSIDWFQMMTFRAMQMRQAQYLAQLNLTDVAVGRTLGSVAVLFIIAAPFLSMRLLADEKRSHTFELLMTAPIRPIQIVVGKYLAALVVMLTAVAIVALFPVVLALFADSSGGPVIEWQTAITGLLGLFLLAAMSMAVGLFVSSLTGSVLVAALVSLIVLLGLWLVPLAAIGREGVAKEIANALSSAEHLGSFLSGRIELKDILYYLSFMAFGLFLTDRAVEGHRWV